MIHTGSRRPALLVASIAAVLEFALAGKEVCLLHGQEVPCPSEISDAEAAAAAPKAAPKATHHKAKKDAGFEAALSDNFFKAAPAPRATAAPTPMPTPAPTPPPTVDFGIGAGGAKQTDEQKKKDMIGKTVAGALGIGAAVAAGAGGIALAVHQAEMEKKNKAQKSWFAPHPKGTPAPVLSPRVNRSEVATGNETASKGSSGSSGGSMDSLKPGHGSLGWMKGQSWESSGDFTWLILLSIILLVCIGCLLGMCVSCRSKKKNVKKAPRAVTVVDLPAESQPSHQEQAPLLQGSFPPPPRGVSGMDQMGTRMDVMPTSTMYNGPAQSGMGGYFPAAPGAMSVSPLALETTPALAPPPPPPKPQQYRSPPPSFQQMQTQPPGPPGYSQQMQTQASGMPGPYQQMQPPGTYTAGLQTQAPGGAGRPDLQTMQAPGGAGRPDLQTMPPQAFSQGYGQPTAPSGYSHTQTMQTMPALPKQPGYGYR